MATAHLDRLSVLDNSFLDLEHDEVHMHVGGVVFLEGPAPECDEVLAHVARRLHLVPRYRQKVLKPPLELGRPMWVDDPCFNLEYHVRHTALPHPGSERQLRTLVGRIFSQRLDRTKPLWELWLVDGMADGRFAIVSKTHHALIDGMSGVDLITVLFDLSPVPFDEGADPQPWQPNPKPSPADLVRTGVVDAALTPARVARRLAGAARHPRQAAEGLRGVSEVLGPPVVAPAPPSPLNGSIGPHRRTTWSTAALSDLKAVKNALGGTVNDVVLAVVAGAIRRRLERHGEATTTELRAMVPVSVRSEQEHGLIGNRVAAMRAPLPVQIADPVRRLRAVSEATAALKESRQAVGAETLMSLQEFAPPTLLAQASRINFSTRLFNLIVTNVPGPQFPVYLLGREMKAIVPFAPLPHDHRVAFAVMSYNGRVSFGLLADFDAVGDLDDLGEDVRASLDELLRAAGRTPQEAPA